MYYNFYKHILAFLCLVLYWEPPEWKHSRALLVSTWPSFGGTCLFWTRDYTLSTYGRQEEVLLSYFVGEIINEEFTTMHSSLCGIMRQINCPTERTRLGTWIWFPQNAQGTCPALSCPPGILFILSWGYGPGALETLARERPQLPETNSCVVGRWLIWGTSPWDHQGFWLLSLKRLHRVGHLVSMADHLFSTPGHSCQTLFPLLTWCDGRVK